MRNRRVENTAATHTCDNAEEDAENSLNQEGVDGKSDGDRECGGQHLGHRSPGEGLPKIKGEDALEVEQVLQPERLIKVVLFADSSCRSLGQALIATEGRDGITWHQVDHRKDQERCSKEDRNGLQETSSDVSQHGQVLLIHAFTNGFRKLVGVHQDERDFAWVAHSTSLRPKAGTRHYSCVLLIIVMQRSGKWSIVCL